MTGSHLSRLIGFSGLATVVTPCVGAEAQSSKSWRIGEGGRLDGHGVLGATGIEKALAATGSAGGAKAINLHATSMLVSGMLPGLHGSAECRAALVVGDGEPRSRRPIESNAKHAQAGLRRMLLASCRLNRAN